MPVRYLSSLPLTLVFALCLQACSPSLGEPLTLAGCQLFSLQGVTELTRDRVGEFLVAEGFCLAEGRRVQLHQGDEALELRIAVKPESRDDAGYVGVAKAFAAQLSGKALEGAPVDVALCDDVFETCARTSGFRWGRYVSRGACGLYVGAGVDHELGERFLALIDDELGCKEARAFRLERGASSLDLYVVLEDADLQEQGVYYQARLSAGRASRVLFDGAPINVHLADSTYVSTRSAPAVDLGPMVTRGACTIFQGEGLTPEFLTRFVGFIDLAGYCNDDPRVYRLSKRDTGWHLALALQSEMSPKTQQRFKVALGLVAAMLRGGVFEGQATYIDLCNPVFEDCESIVGPDLGNSFVLGTCSVFHDRDIAGALMAKLRRWLASERFCEDAEQLLRVRREEEGWAFHLAVLKSLEGSAELKTLGDRISNALSEAVFGGAKVRFIGTNEALIPHRSNARPLSGEP